MKKAICLLLVVLLAALCACVSGETDAPEEASDTEIAENTSDANGVKYDEAGNVILSNPPTYEEVLALYLRDPDELIVCVEQPANPWGGACWITETGTLAIPGEYASLFEGKAGEAAVTGVVVADGDDGLYLKDVSIYLS